LEPWEKAIVSTEYVETPHGGVSCQGCHGGEQSPEKEAAHTGLVADPSTGEQTMCSGCHADIAETAQHSLHATQAGYWTSINARSTPENHPALETMFGNHCASCHTTCGDCHVAQPNSVGGGLFEGHTFVKTPPMTRSCTACHGSRVGNEYLGKNEEIPGDVHFRMERFNCVSCHEGSTLHAAGPEENAHRYSGEQLPACENCHEIGKSSDPIVQHSMHKDKLACQVCHSVQYTNCDSCHVSISETSGNPKFKTSATYLGFFIGRNNRQDEYRPYEYVLVRHVPVDPLSYAFYGDNLLSNFDAAPTWVYATPHNIQRQTPQNAACTNCHGNATLFLTEDKVAESERAANKDVIVTEPPAAIGVK
jgi:thiosulfate/3-mercaptopyruvate sulfurtransferase